MLLILEKMEVAFTKRISRLGHIYLFNVILVSVSFIIDKYTLSIFFNFAACFILLVDTFLLAFNLRVHGLLSCWYLLHNLFFKTIIYNIIII